MRGTYPEEQQMNDLATAREQLEKAIERLEAALATKAGQGDVAGLDEALEQARGEYRNLREVADQVSERIDTVISRLRATLEEDTGHDA
ncbi:MAG TPA: hypothetical protein VLN73_02315 [Alphaproteobacteria bacterium]|nr:hypothetical protein [Alphaproteobacteria bacterium]